MQTLNITNGDCAVELMQAAKITGDFMAWRDLLHLGPVPLCSSLEELSDIRADYLSSLGWGLYENIKQSFAERDATLANASQYDKVILWFEHDLYDQLQLLQVLHWFSDKPDLWPKLYLINPARHLGYHTPRQLALLKNIEHQVTQEQLHLAKRAWLAYCHNTPVKWAELLTEATTALPFLKSAVERSLSELPHPESGLSKTEYLILLALHKSPRSREECFQDYTRMERIEFLGDSSFFWILEQLICDEPPLIEECNNQLQLTDRGKQVLTGRYRWQRQYRQTHWLGGYCISSGQQYFYSNVLIVNK